MNTIIEENKAWIEETWNKIDNKLSKVCIKSRDKIPYTTIDGVHDNKAERGITWWTNGFWGGMMWLMYNETGNEEYRKTAESAEKLLDRALTLCDKLDHDVGFMWHLTSGANYRLTGNKEAYNKNIIAASLLSARYNVDGGFIRAWNGNAGGSIIDTMMNLALLYWASDVTGADRFKRVALHHADMSLRDHIREDGSINHIVEHDVNTGEVVKVHGGQGYSETSCWTRGLAWAIYGMVISYIYSKEKKYLDAAVKTANYFIANCVSYDYLTPIDFKAPISPKYYDSTAGVCAACGLLELSKCVSEAEGRAYIDAAVKILKATDEHFCNYEDNEDAIVLLGSARYPVNPELKNDVHIPIIYGDFFLVEAMLKLKGNDFFIW